MDEFVKGNFSRAGEIIDQYQELLKKCFEEAESKYLGNLNMKDYIAGELENLLKEKDELENQKKEIVDKLNEVKQLKSKLKKENKGDKKWEAIYKKFEEFGSSPSDFEEFLGALKINNPENYKIGEDMIIRFLDSENYKKIKEWMEKNSIFLLKNKRNSITKKLSHKGNFMNIEKQIDDIKKGITKMQLEKNIRDNVKEFFGKKNEFHNRDEDPRKMMNIYVEIMNSIIILNKDVDEKLIREFIRKFQDKFGLWEYIWDIYQELMIRNIEIRESLASQINPPVPQDCGTTPPFKKEDKIVEGEIDNEDKVKKKLIEDIGYWIDFCINNYHMWREKLEEDDIKYLEEKINGEKKHGRDMTKLNDDRLKKIFRILKDYLDDVELENKFEMIRNYLYQGISMDTKRLKEILVDLFKYMDQEDRKDIVERYGDWNAFKEIAEKSKIENNQLSLFD